MVFLFPCAASSPRRIVFLGPIVSGNQILPLPIVAHDTLISHLQL